MRGKHPKPVIDKTDHIHTIESRHKVRVPTAGSQRRCYNGCFPSSDWEMVWTQWEVLETHMPRDRIKFWSELNDYAVSQRGCDSKSEYRIKRDLDNEKKELERMIATQSEASNEYNRGKLKVIDQD